MTTPISITEARGTLVSNIATIKEKNVLGQDDFLKILITQLQNQDPTQPMEDREFISQMATFSSLEQMSAMNKAIQDLRGIMLGQATSYMDKEIVYEVNVYDQTNGSIIGKEQFSSVVTGIENVKGQTYLITSLGHSITFDSIHSVSAKSANPIVENAHLIGKQVEYLTENEDGTSELINAVVHAVSFKDGKVELILDNNDRIHLVDVLKVMNA